MRGDIAVPLQAFLDAAHVESYQGLCQHPLQPFTPIVLIFNHLTRTRDD